ncbi:hypothetical protein [Streptomyces sp. NPDC008139]
MTVSQADQADARIAAWVEEQARNAPPLSEEQLETLHELLRL